MDRTFVRSALQDGSGVRLVLVAAMTLFFLAYMFIDPERRFSSLSVALLGLYGTWRQYLIWSRLRRQDGIELIGTDPDRGPGSGGRA